MSSLYHQSSYLKTSYRPRDQDRRRSVENWQRLFSFKFDKSSPQNKPLRVLKHENLSETTNNNNKPLPLLLQNLLTDHFLLYVQ
jgi:hypothetical protein